MIDVRTRWTAAWLGAVVIGVGNGVAREATYGKRVRDRAAHNLSGVTGIAAFAVYFWQLNRRWPIASDREALRIGATWLVMSIGFEFGFGRLMAKQSWEELLADYNVARGRTWPVVLTWIALGPFTTRRVQSAD